LISWTLEFYCKKPPYINFGIFFYLDANTTHYFCERGYRLIGPEKRNCNNEGTWSGMEPLCLFSGKGIFNDDQYYITAQQNTLTLDLYPNTRLFKQGYN